ncbi:ABC transporter substrate-binding protein [Nitratireductor mangrovi]|uniref:ABC transporter substrate-binding protein n=1 Tax=Nitratireductor mangrovi TaxID=2599600 RepID=A0A5B8L0B8_9HYPH|nr:ABC transporter substrate-binding protein [Nitratireductor mangrovi]QDZ01311.1 ABC transporter substrate-binding protein [Nitratireductor mangrovi]
MKTGTRFFLTALVATTPLTAAAQEDVTVGFAIALSGFVAPYDDGPYKAAKLAIEDINAKGGLLGRKIIEVSADTASDPAQGATAATDVLSKNAELVMVTCDFDFGAPAALVAQSQNKIAFSSCAADAKFGVQGIGPNAYTMATATNHQGAILAEFAWNTLGKRNVYILNDLQVEYNKSLCSNFEKRWRELAGGEGVTGYDEYNAGNDTVIPAQVSRMKDAEAKSDVIMFCGAINGASYVRQIRAAGIDLPMITGESMDGTYWLEAVPDLSEFYNLSYGSIHGDDPSSRVNDFVAKFTKAYGEPPVTGHALTGYGVIEAWARAVESAGSFEADAVRAKLDAFAGEDLLVGKTFFTSDLHINNSRPMTIIKIDGGKAASLGVFDAEKTPEITF